MKKTAKTGDYPELQKGLHEPGEFTIKSVLVEKYSQLYKQVGYPNGCPWVPVEKAVDEELSIRQQLFALKSKGVKIVRIFITGEKSGYVRDQFVSINKMLPE